MSAKTTQTKDRKENILGPYIAIIQQYGLDKPIPFEKLKDHSYLVARETAASIIHLLTGDSGRFKGSRFKNIKILKEFLKKQDEEFLGKDHVKPNDKFF